MLQRCQPPHGTFVRGRCDTGIWSKRERPWTMRKTQWRRRHRRLPVQSRQGKRKLTYARRVPWIAKPWNSPAVGSSEWLAGYQLLFFPRLSAAPSQEVRTQLLGKLLWPGCSQSSWGSWRSWDPGSSTFLRLSLVDRKAQERRLEVMDCRSRKSAER